MFCGRFCASGWHCPPRSQFSRGRDATEFTRATGIFSAAGKVDLEPVRFETCAVRMDDQSIPRLRICVQILLCAVHARIYGAGWLGIREKDFRETRRSAAARAGHAEIFVRVEKLGRSLPGAHRDWDRDRSLPTGGAGIRSDAGVPGGIGETRGA